MNCICPCLKKGKKIRENEKKISSNMNDCLDKKINNVNVINQDANQFAKFKNQDNHGENKFRNNLNVNSSPKKLNLYEKEHREIKQKPFYEFRDKLMCMFCGGEECKHENWKLHPNPAIKGLHSDKITKDIYASQRLSNRLIKEYNIVSQFRKLEIGLIVNVQLEGEHPYCGDKLDLTSGFSYNPQILESENIKCKNYGWKDMSIPDSVNFMLNIVKDMSVSIKEENVKVLVHCHAGYGRTGCVIACYMIYSSFDTLEIIVDKIRSVRPNCIQKKAQMEFCKKFKNYIDRARILFTPSRYNLDYFIKNQNDILFGSEIHDYDYVPKLLKKVLNQSLKLKKDKEISHSDFYKIFYSLDSWDSEHEQKLVEIKKGLNLGNWAEFDKIEEITFLVLILYDWIEDCLVSLIPPEKIIHLFNYKIKEDSICSLIKYSHYPDYISDRKKMCNLIKDNLRLIEFEIIITFTYFLFELFPDDDEESKFLYNNMKERLILLISGISLSTIDYKICIQHKTDKNYFPPEIENLIKYFSLIFDLLINIIRYDMEDDNYRNNIFAKNETVFSSKNYFSIGEFNSNLSPKSGILKLKSKPSLLNKNSEFCLTKDDREREMLRLYETLDGYFRDKKKSADSPIFSPFTKKKIKTHKSNSENGKTDLSSLKFNPFVLSINKELQITNNQSISFQNKKNFEKNNHSVDNEVIINREEFKENDDSKEIIKLKSNLSKIIEENEVLTETVRFTNENIMALRFQGKISSTNQLKSVRENEIINNSQEDKVNFPNIQKNDQLVIQTNNIKIERNSIFLNPRPENGIIEDISKKKNHTKDFNFDVYKERLQNTMAVKKRHLTHKNLPLIK